MAMGVKDTDVKTIFFSGEGGGADPDVQINFFLGGGAAGGYLE